MPRRGSLVCIDGTVLLSQEDAGYIIYSKVQHSKSIVQQLLIDVRRTIFLPFLLDVTRVRFTIVVIGNHGPAGLLISVPASGV